MTLAVQTTLRDAFGSRVRFAEPLSRHTSFRIGGPADVWVDVNDALEVATAQSIANAAELPLWVLGGGTNVLVSDRGVRGIVLHLGRPLARAEWSLDGSRTRVRAGAALPFKKLVTEAVDRGLAGLEFAEGIPGSLGGGLLMNAGAFGGEIAHVVTHVEGVATGGMLQRLPRTALRFGYRHFDLAPGFIVTHVELSLMAGDGAAIAAKRDDAKRRREAHQPLGFPNAGSIFKNPPGEFAGRLLEAVGMKGTRQGGAMVSERHANFIVNVGKATAADVRVLMDEARRRVYEARSIRLEDEIRLIGDWGTPC